MERGVKVEGERSRPVKSLLRWCLLVIGFWNAYDLEFGLYADRRLRSHFGLAVVGADLTSG